jgi:hypothetical protein
VEPDSKLLGEPQPPVVYVYELDPSTSAYVLTGIHHHRLDVAVPYGVVVELGNGTHLTS